MGPSLFLNAHCSRQRLHQVPPRRCLASPRLKGAHRGLAAPVASLPVPPPVGAEGAGDGSTRFEQRQRQKEEALGLERGAFGGGDAGRRGADARNEAGPCVSQEKAGEPHAPEEGEK